MKCINNELIQRYLDGETARSETERIESHIRTCVECTRRVEEQRAFITRLRKQLCSSSELPVVEIPPFVMPDKRMGRRVSPLLANRRYLVYAASVACVLLLLFFVHPKHKKSRKLQPVFLLESDFDANKPVLEQDLMLYLIDEEGKMVNIE